MKTFLQAVVAIVVIGGLGFLAGRCSNKSRPAAEIRTDTIVRVEVIRDTVLTVSKVERVRVDTVFVRVVGGTGIGPTDSVAVEIPIERRVYQTDDYRAVVEGFRANLTEMEVYRRTQFINTTQTVTVPDRRRWNIGIQAGYGITPRGPQPYLGVGVQYNIVKW